MHRGLGIMGCSATGRNLGVREAVPILVPAPLAVEGISPLKKFQGLLKSSIDKNAPLLLFSPGWSGNIAIQRDNHQYAYYVFDISWLRVSFE